MKILLKTLPLVCLLVLEVAAMLPEDKLAAPRECASNEYQTDMAGCEDTCDKPYMSRNETCLKQPRVNGCQCAFGLLRNADGVCVPKAGCIRCVGKGERYDVCGIMNQKTCLTKPGEITIPISCEVGGDCVCQKGFVRDSDYNCIKEDKCPKCPGPHEVYEKSYECEPRCDRLGKGACRDWPPQNNTSGYTIECRCLPGYYRHDNGTCVSFMECPFKCDKGANFTESECLDINAGTCYDTNPYCRKQYCVFGRKYCNCKEGYVLDDRDKCIAVEDCPNMRMAYGFAVDGPMLIGDGHTEKGQST